MRLAAEGIEDKNVQVLQTFDTLHRNVAEIGKVCRTAKAVAGNRVFAMRYGYPLEPRPCNIHMRSYRSVETVNLDASAGRIAVLCPEGVFEDARDRICGGIVGIEWKVAGMTEGQWTQIVHAEDVVRMAVGIEDCVDACDPLT